MSAPIMDDALCCTLWNTSSTCVTKYRINFKWSGDIEIWMPFGRPVAARLRFPATLGARGMTHAQRKAEPATLKMGRRGNGLFAGSRMRCGYICLIALHHASLLRVASLESVLENAFTR
jgi:hypothetical protein